MAKRNALSPIPEHLILERLQLENPWWLTGSIDDEYLAMRPRLYFELFGPLVADVSVRRAAVLMGPRRVGKTVMLYHTIQHLIDQDIPHKKICFINIESPVYNKIGLDQLFGLARQAVGTLGKEGWFVFFDEIQYLKDWEIHLKVLVDTYPHCRFVVSGSAAAALRLKSIESGAGRFTEFMLPPLTFHEFLHLKGIGELVQPASTEWNGNLQRFFAAPDIKELNRQFLEYINFGGYPEVIFSDKIRANPGRFIRSDIIDKVLLRDLPSLYGIQDVQELNSLFSTLAYHSGNEISLETLSKSSGVEKHLLRKYLEYLEAAFLIRLVHRIDDSGRRFQRANFYKVYLTNPSLRSALFAPLDASDESLGCMVETAIYAQWLHRDWFTPWYARWQQGEVDMVGLDPKNLKPRWALEIKWSNRYFERPVSLKSVLQFCERNKLSAAMVTTIDKEGKVEVNGITLQFVPAALYAYTVGANTMEKKKAAEGA